MKTIFTKTSIVWIALAIFTLNMSSCKDEIPNVIEKGKAGSLSWTLTDDGILTISGKGVMHDYEYGYESYESGWTLNTPWCHYQNSITMIIIDKGIKNIGNYAFSGCFNLVSVKISNSVTSIGKYSFEACVKLTNITIPNSVKSIGGFAFYSCFGLKSISIPKSVVRIGESAFYGCSGLTKITIPNSVASIENRVFSNCSGLTSVIIPNSVTSIGREAFFACLGLTDITLPNSITSIGEMAFFRCTELTEITIKATTPPSVYDSGSFYRINLNIPVYVPQESLELYKNADVWKEFTNLQGKVF